jgi:hypothetical protein
MNNFQGYLFKAVKTDQKFPMKYIAFESWDSTPNQREEIKAWREEYSRKLYRITAPGRMSIFSFTTRDNLHLEDKIAIQDFFYNNEVNHDQRTIQLDFWNEESNSYTRGVFYRPNMNFQIKSIEQNDIIYKEMKFEFIQAE